MVYFYTAAYTLRRTVQSVVSKRFRLGAGPPKRKWSAEEDVRLDRIVADGGSVEDAARALGRSRGSAYLRRDSGGPKARTWRSRVAVSALTLDCSFPGCDGSTPRWSVLCDLHRDRLRAGVRLTDGKPYPVAVAMCSVEGCDRQLKRELAEW